MNQNFTSRLLCRLACLLLMAASMGVDVSYAMKRLGSFEDDKGDNKHQKFGDNDKKYPLHQQLIDLEHGEESVINCTCVSPDGEFLAVGFENGVVKILDTQSGRLISELYTKHKGPVSIIKWSPDGNYVLAVIEPIDLDDENSSSYESDSDNENSFNNEIDLGEIDLENEIGSNNEIDLENSLNNENDTEDENNADDTIYLDYSNDYPKVVFWKKDDNRTFKKRHKSCHAMDMEDIILIDFIFTNDAKLVLFTSDGIDAISYDLNNDFELLSTHCSDEFDENNGLFGKKICTYGDGEYCLCGFDGSKNQNQGLQTTIILFQDLKDLFSFEVDGKLLDCALSHHNQILLLTCGSKQGNATTATCYSTNQTCTGAQKLFTLEHDNCALEKLYYSSDCAFIIGHANQQDMPAVVFIWDCSGKLLRKITIDDANTDGEVTLYTAKIVDTVLTLVFSDDEHSWSTSFNLANTHQYLMKREYGIKPPIQNIQFQSLLVCIDKQGKLTVKTGD